MDFHELMITTEFFLPFAISGFDIGLFAIQL